MMDGIGSKMKNSFIAVLITLLLLSALSGCGADSEKQALSADNVAINYRVEGEGTPALVFVHGWSCEKSYWKYQVPHFSKRYKVVTIDLAGHGESGSGRKDWTMEAFGKDVAAVVEKLDLHRVILIGHSMGGPVIIEAARQMPERVIGLVGVDTFLDLGRQYTQQQVDAYVAPFERDFAAATGKLVRLRRLAERVQHLRGESAILDCQNTGRKNLVPRHDKSENG